MLDVSGDFVDVVDGLAPVTLVDRCGRETAIAKSLRRAITQREAAASDGRYATSDVVFHLPLSSTSQPELGSQIVDDLDEWTVLEVARETLSARWRCVTRDLAVTTGLDTLVDVEVAEYTKSEGGAHTPTWSSVAKRIRAKVYTSAATREVEHKSVQLPPAVTVTLHRAMPLTTRHRIIAADGTPYRVLGWESPKAIDQLMVATVEPM